MKPARVSAFAAVALAALVPVILYAQDAKPAGDKPAPKPADAIVAATGKFTVDPVHSSNAFRIRHLAADFYGRFNEMTGECTLDDAHPEKSTIAVQIKTASIDTNNEARDKHLRSPELFDVEKYPEIAFKSTKVQKVDDKTWSLTGDLTFHGTTKPITVQIAAPQAVKGMKGEIRCGFGATFDIKRSEYGMGALVGPLGDDVRIMVGVEGVSE